MDLKYREVRENIVLSIITYKKCKMKLIRSYSPLRGLTSSSWGGLWQSAKAFFALQAKKEIFKQFVPILGYFWCSVVFSVVFSCNIRIFENYVKKNSKNQKKKSKIHKSKKVHKIFKKSEKKMNKNNPKKS